jgi:hypothetical protein
VPSIPLRWQVREEPADTVVTLTGDLVAEEAGGLYLTVEDCLGRRPAALIVELSGATVLDDMVLREIERRAARWPGTPVVFIGGGRNGFDNVEQVRDLLPAGPSQLSEPLLPSWDEARHARDITTDACLRWQLPHLAGPAALVASELVVNAVDHARTMMTLHVKRDARHLYVAVEDGSPTEPGKARGHGLSLVESLSAFWGSTTHPGGKVVWAALAVTPDSGQRSDEAGSAPPPD